MPTSLPTRDISAVFANTVVTATEKAVRSVSDASQTKAVRTHSSGNPAVFMLPFYALMVMGVFNWVNNELPKWYGR